MDFFNSMAPGKFEWNFRHVIFKQIFVIDGWGISCEIVLIWMSLDFTHDQSTLVQVMAWCRQATSHYLSQCWPSSMSPYDVTRPQCVNSLWPGDALLHQRSSSTLVPLTVTWTNVSLSSKLFCGIYQYVTVPWELYLVQRWWLVHLASIHRIFIIFNGKYYQVLLIHC